MDSISNPLLLSNSCFSVGWCLDPGGHLPGTLFRYMSTAQVTYLADEISRIQDDRRSVDHKFSLLSANRCI